MSISFGFVARINDNGTGLIESAGFRREVLWFVLSPNSDLKVGDRVRYETTPMARKVTLDTQTLQTEGF
jgi:hypothetical protein